MRSRNRLKIHARPLADIVPPSTQIWRTISSCWGSSSKCWARHGRVSATRPASSSFQVATSTGWLNWIIGIKARRFEAPALPETSAKGDWAEDELLDAIVPCRDREQHGAYCGGIAHVAAGQHGERAEAHRAAQEITAIDVLDQRLVLFERTLVDYLPEAGGSRTKGNGRPWTFSFLATLGASKKPGSRAFANGYALSSYTTGPPVTIASQRSVARSVPVRRAR